MAVQTVPMPQPDLQRVAEANAELVDVARGLYALASKSSDPALSHQLLTGIEKMLESSRTISKAFSAASTGKG